MVEQAARGATVLGVVGGSGGVGASTFAAVLAAGAQRAVLVDLDGVGGGIDVLLGIEAVPGARWSQVRLGGGHLDPDLLAAGLPRWGPVPVLAADAGAPPPTSVGTVLDAAGELGTVVVNLPRGPCATRDAALSRCAVVIVVAVASVAGLAAARAVVAALPEVPAGLVVRRGAVTPAESGRLVGAALMGVAPRFSGRRLGTHCDRPLHPSRLPVPLVRVAAGLLDGIQTPEARGLPSAASGGRGTR